MYGMANTSDSMILGSPVSANTSAHQPQFLPGYLLGDSSFAGGSSPITPQRLWTPGGGGHSPPKSSASRLMSPQAQTSGLLVSPRSEHRTPAGRDFSHRAKDKSGAPPVMGLFDQINSPIPAHGQPSHYRSMNMDNSYNLAPINQSVGPVDYDASFQHQRHTTIRSDVPSSGLFSPPGDLSSMMTSPGRETPPSPPQVDPFYTQGESIRPDDRLDETWVTVFGFSAAAASFLLQQFSQYGNIIQHVVAPEGNWMHLHYQSKIQAKKALSKNGKIFGNGIMVGVQPCIDKKLMDQYRESGLNASHATNVSSVAGLSTLSALSSAGTPVQQIGAQDGTTPVRRTPSMRPLTSAYREASSDHDVVNDAGTPQRSTSVIGRALEYVFGW